MKGTRAILVGVALASAWPQAGVAKHLDSVWVDSKDPASVLGRFDDGSSEVLFGTNVLVANPFSVSKTRLEKFEQAELAPNKSRIAFIGRHGATAVVGLYHLSNKGATLLTISPKKASLSWSEDGTHFVVTESTGPEPNAIMLWGKSARMEISGETLAEAGFAGYGQRYEHGADASHLVYTAVFDPHWVSATVFGFKTRRVRLSRPWAQVSTPTIAEEAAERWRLNLATWKFSNDNKENR